MFPTFCAVEIRCCSALTIELHYLVIRTPVLPRECRRVDGAEGCRLLLIAHDRLLAQRRDLPVRRVRRALGLRHVGDRLAQRRKQYRPAAAAHLLRDLPRRAAAVNLRVAATLFPAEHGAQVLLHMRGPVPVAPAESEELRYDLVEKVLAERRLERR